MSFPAEIPWLIRSTMLTHKRTLRTTRRHSQQKLTMLLSRLDLTNHSRRTARVAIWLIPCLCSAELRVSLPLQTSRYHQLPGGQGKRCPLNHWMLPSQDGPGPRSSQMCKPDIIRPNGVSRHGHAAMQMSATIWSATI